MIKFFRKIRQDLLSEGKTGKYLKYAVGEIILVVIGILIALQINNWNENQKENKLEQNTLFNLKKEFETNQNNLKNTLENNKQVRDACFDLTDMIRSNRLNEESNKLDSLLLKAQIFYTFEPKRGVVDEIISSGKLNIIKNDSLRTYLTGWTGTILNAEEDIGYRYDNYHQNLIPFLSKNFPLSNGELFKEILDEEAEVFISNYEEASNFKVNFNNLNLIEFENAIWLHKNNNDFVIYEYSKMVKEINFIIDVIEQELEKQ